MSFPCISCSIVLPNSLSQREHYKSDWHRYNLKRKVAGLPPVSLEEFNIKSAIFTKADEAGEASAVGVDLPHCSVCHKKFSSPNAYDNHVSSRKHQQKVAASANKEQQRQQQQDEWVDEDSEGGSSSEETPLALEECLFCSRVSKSASDNCAHMLRHHGFALPDADCVSDLDGLLTLLDYKIGVGYECLWCHGSRGFDSVRAVQQHMVDSGHCRYNLAGEHAFDLADFYDFGDVPDGAFDDDEGDGDDEEATDKETFELVLPSGAVVGHRSLMRYYRQSLPPERRLAKPGATAAFMAKYRALGWQEPHRTQQQLLAVRDTKFVQRHRQKMRTKLGVKANQLQHHFRSQNPI